jgi:hypothetical protein
MGLFDWLTGKRREPSAPPREADSRSPAPHKPNSPRRSRPKAVHDLGDDSPFISVDMGNGMMTLMDREMFDYLYTESSLPDPSQRDLDALMSKVTRVRVFSGGMMQGEPMDSDTVIETSEPSALTDFRLGFAIIEDPK